MRSLFYSLASRASHTSDGVRTVDGHDDAEVCCCCTYTIDFGEGHSRATFFFFFFNHDSRILCIHQQVYIYTTTRTEKLADASA